MRKKYHVWKKILLGIVILFIFQGILLVFVPSTLSNFNGLKTSVTYNTAIIIDEKTPNDWEWAKTEGYASGSGTESDPYVIENDVIDLEGGGGPALSIRNSQKFFVIRNMEFRNTGPSSSDRGLEVINTTKGEIIDNYGIGNGFGIYTQNTSKIFFINNVFTSSLLTTFYFLQSINNTIRNNLITNGQSTGIRFGVSDNNTIILNNITNNEGNGISFENSEDNLLRGNRIINNRFNGMYFDHGSRSTIENNFVYNNSNNGLLFEDSSNFNALIGNNISSNKQSGIEFKFSSIELVNNNSIENNSIYGVYIDDSNTINVSENEINYNLVGVVIDNSFDNIVTNNKLRRNDVCIIDESPGLVNIITENNCIDQGEEDQGSDNRILGLIDVNTFLLILGGLSVINTILIIAVISRIRK